MRRILFPGVVVVFACVYPVAAQTITLESLLGEMIDRDRLAKFPSPAYTCRQFSSYDRESTSPSHADTWFANGDAGKFLRVEKTDKIEGGEEFVMMDADGPGAVVRFWSANPRGNVYVYVDGASEPTLTVPMADLLGGKWKVRAPLSETVAKGWNLYLPIPYAKHLKVTCAGKRIKEGGKEYNEAYHVYYQINHRTYPAGTPIESFSMPAFDRAAATLDRVTTTLANPAAEPGTKTALTREPSSLGPSASQSFTLPPGPGAARFLELGVSAPDSSDAAREQALRNLVISMEFDGQKTVWCPVGDFFGSGVGLNVYADWYRSVLSSQKLQARWVMPYKTSAKVTLSNLGKAPLRFALSVSTEPYAAWDDASMHFHCAWHYEYPIHAQGGRGTRDWNYVEVSGKGVYVGDSLAVMNPTPDWWGEGDEKVYVDGETFPSHFGTGTEDYYGYAWSAPITFASAFHAQPRCDGQKDDNTRGHSTVTRTRSLDAIPFTRSLKFDMEVWHWRECDMAYAATTYFYAMPGGTTNRKEQPEAAGAEIVQPPPPPPPKKIEGAIEGETLKVLSKSAGTEVGPQGGWKGTWSGETHLWVRGHKVGDFVEVEIPAGGGKPVNLTVYGTRSWDYGIVRFSIGGKQVGQDVDMFNSVSRDVVSTGPIDLGKVTPKDGKIILRAEVVGGNPKSEGTRSFFGIDCVVLTPAP